MPRRLLIDFAERAKGLDDTDKLKLILFAGEIKKNTYIILKITPGNLVEKFEFEQLLKRAGVVYELSKPKSFEQITRIKKNSVQWDILGYWHGYDLFENKESKKRFKRYKQLLKQGRHKQAHKIAGELYDYPPCCIKEYTQQENPNYIKKYYSYTDYYRMLHKIDRNFPLLMHTACSPDCAESRRLNITYDFALKHLSPRFWRYFSKIKKYHSDLIVDTESDVFKDGRSIWPKRTGHEYVLISRNKVNGKHYMFPFLTNKKYERGTVLSAEVNIRYDYADIFVHRVKRKIKDIHHERHFYVLGRKY